MIKDSDAQPDEEIHRARSGRVRLRSLSLHGGRMHQPPSTQVFSPTQKLSELHTYRDFGEVSSHGCDQLLSHSLAPLLFQEDWGAPESSKLLIMAWPFILKLSRSPLRVTSLSPKTLPSPRKFQRI